METGFGNLVYQIFIDYVGPVLVSIIMVILSAVLKKILDKLKLNISETEQKKILSTAETLVLAIEEQTAAKLKTLKLGGGDTGQKIDKLSTVVGLLIKQFPALSEEQAEKIALAAVAKLPGIGITQLALPSTCETEEK
jgi:hypothetical protein